MRAGLTPSQQSFIPSADPVVLAERAGGLITSGRSHGHSATLHQQTGEFRDKQMTDSMAKRRYFSEKRIVEQTDFRTAEQVVFNQHRQTDGKEGLTNKRQE